MKKLLRTGPAVILSFFLLSTSPIVALTASSGDWTPWEPVKDWAQFGVLVEFHGGPKSADQLIKMNQKSVKVDCLIVGRVSADVPPEVAGVKVFRIIYATYGKTRMFGGFAEDSFDVYFSKNGTNISPYGITRAASQFDVDEALKPGKTVEVSTRMPTILRGLGIDGDLMVNSKRSGRFYMIESEWRRKGSTVEIRLKDYRP